MTIQTVKDLGSRGYEVTMVGGDVLFVPNDTENRHYQEVQDWIAEPNTPDSEFTLNELKTNRKAEVDQLKADKMGAGFSHDGDTWPANDESIACMASITARINSGGGLPAGFVWLNQAGATVAVTESEFDLLNDAFVDWLNQVHLIADDHKTNIDAQVDEAGVNGYDITSGWPS